MSVANESDMVGLHDPTHYPPGRPRDKSAQQPMPDDVEVLLGQMRENAGRRISQPAPRHARLETAAPQFPRRPRDSLAMGETPISARRGTVFGGAGRVAAAVGVSAIVALLFVTMMPTDDRKSFSAAVGPFTTLLSPQYQGEDASKSALAEFQPLLAGNDTAQAAERVSTDTRQSDKILQQFLQWRQKANPSAAAR